MSAVKDPHANIKDTVNFEALFEGTPGPYLVLLPDPPSFTIVAANDAYLKATLTERDKILGRGIFEVFPDNPNDPTATGTENLRTSLDRAVAQKKPDTMAVQKYDIPNQALKDGFEVRYWSPLNTPVLDEEGAVKYIIHRVEDVTDFMELKQKSARQSKKAVQLKQRTDEMEAEIYKRAQEIQGVNKQLHSANKKLHELDKLKTEFFTNISHEFRTPLTLMLGPVEEMLDDMDLSEAHREKLALAHRNMLRLQNLVNNLLEFSALEAGKARASFRPVDLSVFTKELASSFRSAMQTANIAFTVDCRTLPEKVYVDTDMWEKVVFNLLSNALKFTLHGSVTISVRTSKDGKSAELAVADTGAGIPTEEIPRLFERFHRLKGTESRSFEGSGIGLALTREIVDLHAGTITVDSELSKGAAFTISIPYGKSHLPADQIVETDFTPGATRTAKAYLEEAKTWLNPPTFTSARQKPGGSILVVDDNADMRVYISRTISAYTDLTVVTAANGKEALEHIQEGMPLLIITDIMMPEMDGFELVDEIRKQPGSEKVPIIFLSARAGEQAKIDGIIEGIDAYLVKPFSKKELLAHVQAVLKRIGSRGNEPLAENTI